MNLYPLLMAVLGLATIPGVLRLLRGPTEADRVIGLDLLFAVAVAGCVLAALASGRAVFLDVGIGIALIGFVATLAWARLVAMRPARKQP